MNNIINSDIFNSGCEMIVLPISTNATISSSFISGIEKSKIALYSRKTRYTLGEIEIHKINNHKTLKYIALACSVAGNTSTYISISLLGERIANATKSLKSIKSIGIPLLGTGAGKLDYLKSLNTIFESFYIKSRLSIDLVFCIPDKAVFNLVKGNIVSSKGVSILRLRQLVLNNKKTKSKRLDLGNCGIDNLEKLPELFNCIHLEELILSNEWGEFDNGHWVRRKSDNKGVANRIQSLPKDLGKLKNLKTLICGGDWNVSKSKNYQGRWGIKNISSVTSLKKLTVLNVSNNNISDVGEIINLKKLQYLYLNNNSISIFPDISSIKSLSYLYLSNNELSNVNFLSNSLSLKTVDLHSNSISDLTPLKNLISKIGIVDSKWTINTISIASNPLQIPSLEIISQGKEKVIAYFKQFEAEQDIKLSPYINKDIKLILVGNSNVGKSTLIHWLKNRIVKKDIPTTHWMIVDKWHTNFKGKDYTVRIFDFGGQEYYHDTHHLFFTNNTAYVVLWDRETDLFDEKDIEQFQQEGITKKVSIQTFPLTFWLDSIYFHTKKKSKTESEKEIEQLLAERERVFNDTNKSADEWVKHLISSDKAIENVNKTNENILVIQNKVDTINDKVFIDEKSLKDNYARIFDFMSISVWESRNLESFEENLYQVFDTIPVIGKEFLGSWGIIKNKIESEVFEEPFSLKEFRKYCNDIISKLPQVKGKSKALVKKVLFTDQDTQSFAQYLNDIGILLYFPEDKELREKVFVNQGKVLKNIYDILKGLDSSYGQFNVKNVITNLGKKDIDNEVSNTINLMLHFKIIFEHPAKEETFIAPLYLPSEPIESIKIFIPLFHKPVYRYEYKKFIYKNVILDFFNCYGKKALKESQNADNYYYWKDGIVLRDDETEEIIMVKFFPAKKDEQLAYIDVYKINGKQSEVFLSKVIQDLDNINKDWEIIKTVSGNGNDFIPLSVIHQNEEEENWVFQYKRRYYNLIDFKKYFKKSIKLKKIFISYSKQDFGLVTKFLEHLSALRLDGKVADWYCSELMAGSDWDKAIQNHFEESNIICFMISPNFMKTKYIHEHEIANAFARKAIDPSFKIVPIILDFCRWNTTKNDLSQFTALPYTAKPVVDFDNQNMAWYIIQECLRLMIDEDLNPIGEEFFSSKKLPSDLQKLYKRIVEDRVDKNSL